MLVRQTGVIESKSHNETVAKIQKVIDAEHFASTCYRRLAELIKNGRIKKQFIVSAETARANKGYLLDYLKEFGVNDFILEEVCTFCKMNPESFSLAGGVDLSLEISNVAIRYYKELSEVAPGQDRREWLRAQLKQKIRQRDLLKKERNFEYQTAEPNSIHSLCISYIISKLSE